MDGRRRIAEPVTDGAHGRPAAGAAPAFRRVRARSGLRLGSARLGRYLRRWLGPVHSWQLPRGTGMAAAGPFLFASAAFGVGRGGHLPASINELPAWTRSPGHSAGFPLPSIWIGGE